MPQTADNPLAPHYYRDNFLRLCETVQARYGDLLDEAELYFLAAFSQLPRDGQCLYVRLVSRVGPWFREAKLDYPEIDNQQQALDQLLDSGLAIESAELSTDDLDQLYTRGELQQVFAEELRDARFARKADLLDAIDNVLEARAELPQAFHDLEDGRVIAPAGTDTVGILQVLFFGNRRQSLTDFVLEDLGVTRYYPYRLEREQRLFSCRAALDEYLALASLSDLYYELVERQQLDLLPDFAQQLLELQVQYPSSGHRWSRLCNRLSRDLERQGQDDLALAVYTRSDIHPARERRARVLEKQENWQAAKRLCQDIISNPWCEAEAEAAQRILPRVSRKLGEKPAPRRRDAFEEVQLVVPASDLNVELASAAHLAADWSSVHYVENSLMNALFGLAFWEQIFAPVPGAFHHAYQSGPSDMYEPRFREVREDILDARFGELASADLTQELLAAFHRYHGYQCRWLDWRYLDAQLLEYTLNVIPREHLLAVLQRILFDPRENRGGFPDLIALGHERGDYCMIEVKGPGDTLQDNQKRWLRFFQAKGIPARVAWVQWQDD